MSLFGSRASGGEDAAPVQVEARAGDHLLALAKLVPPRPVQTDEIVVANGGRDGCLYVVFDGCLVLKAWKDGVETTLATLAAGDGLHVPETPPGLGGALVARESSTVLVIPPDLAARLPISLQAVVWRIAASTATRVVAIANDSLAALGTAIAELGRLVAEREAQSRQCLGSQLIRAAVGRIPALPAYAVDLAGRLLQDDAPVNEIVESIKGDPSLAALVLKTVNSAYFGLQTKVSDYYRAFLILGASNVYRLVLDSGLRAVMPDTPEGRDIQSRSYLVSTIASEIALRSKTIEAQLASTVGLLHDIGATVGLVLRKREPELAPFFALVDAAKIGADLLATWGLPPRVYRVVEQQHLPEYLPPRALPVEDGPAIAVLYLARVLASLALADEAHHPSAAFAEQYVRSLGFPDSTCESLLRDHILPALAKHARHLPQHVRSRVAGLGG